MSSDASNSPPADMLDTKPLLRHCSTYSVWPEGSICRLTYSQIRASALPPEVKQRLDAMGCGLWLTDPDFMVPLGESVPDFWSSGVLPRPKIPIEELARMIQAQPTPDQRREEERKEAERQRAHQERIDAERRAREQAELARTREMAKAKEVEHERVKRSRSLSYLAGIVEKLERSIQTLTGSKDAQ